MEITNIRVQKNRNISEQILAIASIQLDNCLVIHDIKLVENNGKRLLSFPNKKTKKYVMENGEYSEVNTYTDIVHPSNTEFREYLEKEIFKVYDYKEEREKQEDKQADDIIKSVTTV